MTFTNQLLRTGSGEKHKKQVVRDVQSCCLELLLQGCHRLCYMETKEQQQKIQSSLCLFLFPMAHSPAQSLVPSSSSAEQTSPWLHSETLHISSLLSAESLSAPREGRQGETSALMPSHCNLWSENSKVSRTKSCSLYTLLKIHRSCSTK